MIRHLLISLLLFCLFGMAVYGCTNQSPMNTSFDLTAAPTGIYQMSSQIAAASIQELAYYSDLVVIGRVVAKEKVINTSRDTSNFMKASAELYRVNQVYQVQIEKVIKGSMLESLLLCQNQGDLLLTSNKAPSVNEIEAEIQRNEHKTFIPLTLGKRYLFFLRVADKRGYDLDGYVSSDLYVRTMEPWLFEIADTGMVIPETLLRGLSAFFPPVNLETFLEAINQPYSPGQEINPYPGASAPETQIESPYP
jgi:hypothetical protein